MKNKIIRIAEIGALALLFYFSDRFFKIFLAINWAVEELQKKRGHIDRGERKFDKESLVCLALVIPEGTKLTGPEIKKLRGFDTLSKEHIYRIIDLYREIKLKDEHQMKLMRMNYFRNFFPRDYV